jgi:hypothetical protein
LKKFKNMSYFVTVFSLLLISSCFDKHLENLMLPNGGNRPRYPDFDEKFTQYTLPKDSPIKTDVLYIHEETGTKGVEYSFIRFFRTGQVYLGHGLAHFPTSKDYDSFDAPNTEIGYFKAGSADRYNRFKFIKIEIEVYVPIYGDNYHNIIAFLEQDNVLRISYEEYGEPLFIFFGPPASKTEIDRIYLPFENVEFQNFPDW